MWLVSSKFTGIFLLLTLKKCKDLVEHNVNEKCNLANSAVCAEIITLYYY